MILVPALRPADWSDTKKLNKVKKALKDDEGWRRAICQILIRDKKTPADFISAQTTEGETPKIALSAAKVHLPPALTGRMDEPKLDDYEDASTMEAYVGEKVDQEESLVLDNAAQLHIRNSLKNYVKVRDARPGEYVGGGLSQTRIVFWGKKTVMADGDIKKVELTLSEVAYVPEWRKNVVSADVLEKEGVFYNSEKKVLYRSSSKEVIARLSAHDGFRYLLYVPQTSDVDYSAYAAMPTTTIYEGEAVKPRQATALQWHAILGHPGRMSLSKLEKITIGAKVTMATAPTTTDCEPCALSKAKRIVSRRSDHQEETSEPFKRVGFDLIPMETSMDGMQWVPHLSCYATKYEMVECHSRKSDAVNILERLITSISVRFKKEVRFVQTDDEQAPSTPLRRFTKDLRLHLGMQRPLLCRAERQKREVGTSHHHESPNHAYRSVSTSVFLA